MHLQKFVQLWGRISLAGGFLLMIKREVPDPNLSLLRFNWFYLFDASSQIARQICLIAVVKRYEFHTVYKSKFRDFY